jgi:hypothetical protein
MSTPMVPLGTITASLEDDLKQRVRQHGIVIWLDKDAHYTGYVDQLVQRYQNQDFPFPVVPFRGSYLEMLLALEPYGNGDLPDRVIVHLPGHNTDTVLDTPILELYQAGHKHLKALATLIRESATGKVAPDVIEAYLNNGVSDLAAAEQWLESALNQPQDDLTLYLTNISLEWILEGLLRGGDFKAKFQDPPSRQQLLDHLYQRTGLDQGFVQFYIGQDTPSSAETPSFQEIGELFAAWLMGVEYVHDLTRPPHIPELKPLKSLSSPLVKTCQELVRHFRQRYPKDYERLANIVEQTRLKQELSAMQPEDLGKIDTFKGEETVILDCAIAALEQQHWQKALDWAESRNSSRSFWLQRDRNRQIEWSLVREAAYLGTRITTAYGDTDRAKHPLAEHQTLREALDYYTQTGHIIDNAHRRFEQQRLTLLEVNLPHFQQLYEIANALRVVYRQWADALNADFAKICEQAGFLPEADLQQRTLYEQVVHPLIQSGKGKVAFFLVDALRYEMAVELMAELQDSGTSMDIKGRLAELPTITAVGMNALAPVSQVGKLVLANQAGFKGFKTGEYTVSTRENRVRAMGERSVDNVSTGRRRTRLFTLNELRDLSTKGLRQSCASAELIVVHDKDMVDGAGEANVGLLTFEESLQQLKNAWKRLKSAGIQNFVFTADHGFLLQDSTTRAEATFGSKRDPFRRYVFDAYSRSEDGCVTVSLASLNYEGQDGYLLFRRDTAIFAKGATEATFVHGGNSLQERVIPVLTLSHRHKDGHVTAHYRVEAEALKAAFNYNRLRLRLQLATDAQSVLQFSGADRINLALRVPGRDDIQVIIKEVTGAAVVNQTISLAPRQDWVEVFFDLVGPKTERVKVEAYHPDQMEQVEAAIPVEFFDVSSQGTPAREAEAQEEPGDNPEDWQAAIADEGIRMIFVHLHRHGSITETEMTQMLGNARQVRRFSRTFEEYADLIPFTVRIEPTGSGKRYVRDY